jgi:hypothetical protein
MVVLRCTQNGSYRPAELDGTVSNFRFAAFCLVPYHARSRSSIPVMRLVDDDDLSVCARYLAAAFLLIRHILFRASRVAMTGSPSRFSALTEGYI